MFKLFLTLFLIAKQSWSVDLQTGDVILQPLKCNLCSMIESETQSIYSHIGIVIETTPKKIMVAEAYTGKVRIVSLPEYLSKTEMGQFVQVRRLKEMQNLDTNKKEIFNKLLISLFIQKFLNKPYDHFFSMDEEKYYCSELVLKLLNPFLRNKIKTKPMSFYKNERFWENYFHHNVPNGLPGISPANFEKSKLFETIKIEKRPQP